MRRSVHMKFNEYEYKRPEMDEIKNRFMNALEKFTDAGNADEQIKAMEEINEIRNYVGTMFNLVYIRHSIDTNDEFYKAENDYLDDFSPEMEELTSKFYNELVRSNYRQELGEMEINYLTWQKPNLNLFTRNHTATAKRK